MRFSETIESGARLPRRGAPRCQQSPRGRGHNAARRPIPELMAAEELRWWLAILVLAFTPIAAAQQEPVSERAFFAPVEVSVVNVEVFATDAAGRPVAGLISSDFEIQEDGDPVTVTHFYAAPGVARDRSGAAPAFPPVRQDPGRVAAS